MNIMFTKRTRPLMKGTLSEILRVASSPDIVSLSGGLPAPETFPVTIIDRLNRRVIEKYGAAAFQYGPTAGVPVLREEIARWLQERNMKVDPSRVGITSGSQGALDAIGKLFIEKGVTIAVESPTYLGALDAFSPYHPTYAAVQTDDEGVIPSALDRVLKKSRAKLVYLVPTFQNPTGKTIPQGRRRDIAGIIKKHHALLIEDDPYNNLRYRGTPIDPIYTYIPDNTIYLGSFSKVLAPGLRIGFFVAPENIFNGMVAVKSAVVLHTNGYCQYVAAEYLKGGDLKTHLPKIVDIYRSRQEAMLSALGSYFPSAYRFTKPEGGMFIWVEGPAKVDTSQLYWKAVEHKVAFVPGQFFFTGKAKGKNTMRLNFTNVSEEKIGRAVKTLAQIL